MPFIEEWLWFWFTYLEHLAHPSHLWSADALDLLVFQVEDFMVEAAETSINLLGKTSDIASSGYSAASWVGLHVTLGVLEATYDLT